MSDRDRLLCFIKTLRESWCDMEALFMEGQNYNFHRVLMAAFPDLDWQCWQCMESGMVFSKTGGIYYDIRGDHRNVPDNITYVPDYWDSEIIYESPIVDTRRLVDVYVPTA